MKLIRLPRGITRADLTEDDSSVAPPVMSGQLRSILGYASLAPSGHNAQPWRVRVGDGELSIGSDQARWLPKVDPTNREVTLSLGAFVENLLIAAPAFGYGADIEVMAPSPSGDAIRVRLEPAAPRLTQLEKLRVRRTIRVGHSTRELSTADVAALRTAAGVEYAHFFARTSKQGRLLAEGTLEANIAQTARDDAQEELADWIRWSDVDARARRTGFTPESLEITGLAGWYVRHFMDRKAVLGKRFRAQSVARVRQQVARYGGWLVITSADATAAAIVDAGRRCERMWLSARERSIAVHPMSQMLEEAPFKDHIVRGLDLPGKAQFILRVSYVHQYPKPVSLRVPVSWFVTT